MRQSDDTADPKTQVAVAPFQPVGQAGESNSINSLVETLSSIAKNLARIADHFDPPPPDKVGTRYVADRLGCTIEWVSQMADGGKIPRNCIVPGTGGGKPWKFFRTQIDKWIESR